MPKPYLPLEEAKILGNAEKAIKDSKGLAKNAAQKAFNALVKKYRKTYKVRGTTRRNSFGSRSYSSNSSHSSHSSSTSRGGTRRKRRCRS